MQCLSIPNSSVVIKGGKSWIGSNSAYPEERSEREIFIQAFQIDKTEVTNAQFEKFVNETEYITDAEQLQAGFNSPGGVVFFEPTDGHPNWWKFVTGANWRHPEGPESSIEGKADDPVVQVTLNDARAYAKWAGRSIPSEEQWEYAAKAKSDSLYVWGQKRTVKGEEMANTWQGNFPYKNDKADGFESRAPVACFDANDYGLYDMIGNVWEWTETSWGINDNYVIKGGSFLCSENFCHRYRASARQFQEFNLSTNHIGFRTIKKL